MLTLTHQVSYSLDQLVELSFYYKNHHEPRLRLNLSMRGELGQAPMAQDGLGRANGLKPSRA